MQCHGISLLKSFTSFLSKRNTFSTLTFPTAPPPPHFLLLNPSHIFPLNQLKPNSIHDWIKLDLHLLLKIIQQFKSGSVYCVCFTEF